MIIKINGVLTGSTCGVQILHFLATRSLMASNHNQIIKFLGNADDWEAYVEQLVSYFVANGIATVAKK